MRISGFVIVGAQCEHVCTLTNVQAEDHLTLLGKVGCQSQPTKSLVGLNFSFSFFLTFLHDSFSHSALYFLDSCSADLAISKYRFMLLLFPVAAFYDFSFFFFNM